MTTPRIGILGFPLSPDSQSEEANKETIDLFVHINELCKKDGDQGASDTIQCLYDYYRKSPEDRLIARQKIDDANIGYNMDTHMHIFYLMKERPVEKEIDPDLGEIDIHSICYNDIIGYLCYYDDGKPFNPVIVIGDRFVTRAYQSIGFYRSVIKNLMASQEERLPLFKTDILTHTMDDLNLFVSLNFVFTLPPADDTDTPCLLSHTEVDTMGKALSDEVNEGKVDDTTILIERYSPLVDKEYHLFQMIYILPYCHSCRKRDCTLKQCHRCQSVVYCSPECQKKAWPEHKLVCSIDRV